MYVGTQVYAGLRTETVASDKEASSYMSDQPEFLASIAIAQSSAQVEAFNAGSMGYQIPLQPPSQSFAPQVVPVPVSPFDSSSS